MIHNAPQMCYSGNRRNRLYCKTERLHDVRLQECFARDIGRPHFRGQLARAQNENNAPLTMLSKSCQYP